jgi:hypothetical protein
MKPLDLTLIISSMIAAVTVSAGGHAAPAAPEQWPDQAYRVEWEEAHIPEEVAANIKIAVPVSVRNNGDRVWPASQVFVAYHWFRDDRLVVWDGERTPLPRDLQPGRRAAVSVRVATPTEPGSYVLTLTLVHEHVTWFEHKGAAMTIRPVAVRPPTQSSDFSIGGVTP